MKTEEKTNILLFTDWFLPGYKAGGPVTSVANLAKALSDDFTFYIITRDTDYLEDEPYADVESGKWITNKYCDHVFYVSQDRTNKRALKSAIDKVSCAFWYINGVYSWYFSILPLLLARQRKETKVVVAPRGMLSSQGVGVKTLKKRLFLKFARIAGLYRGVIFQATTDAEKHDIQNFFPRNEVRVAANLPKPLSYHEAPEIDKQTGKVTFVSIARIAPEKNTLGALKYLKQWSESPLYEEDALIQYEIYGQIYNRDYWSQCMKLIERLPGNIIVSYKGTITPQKTQSVFVNAHFLFLPTQGENFGHSIVESFASGRPVLISENTPWCDLEKYHAGWDIPLSNEMKYIQTIQDCIQMDQTEYRRMSIAALDYAKQKVYSTSTLNTYLKLFAK